MAFGASHGVGAPGTAIRASFFCWPPTRMIGFPGAHGPVPFQCGRCSRTEAVLAPVPRQRPQRRGLPSGHDVHGRPLRLLRGCPSSRKIVQAVLSAAFRWLAANNRPDFRISPQSRGRTPQILVTYSITARSLENFPIPAVFRMERRAHSRWSAKTRAASSCAATYPS